MKVEEIEGVYLNLVEPDDWKCVASLISANKRMLCRIYKTAFGYEVQYLTPSAGAPQWKGEWWAASITPSITDTLEHAKHLAAQFLHGASI